MIKESPTTNEKHVDASQRLVFSLKAVLGFFGLLLTFSWPMNILKGANAVHCSYNYTAAISASFSSYTDGHHK